MPRPTIEGSGAISLNLPMMGQSAGFDRPASVSWIAEVLIRDQAEQLPEVAFAKGGVKRL